MRLHPEFEVILGKSEWKDVERKLRDQGKDIKKFDERKPRRSVRLAIRRVRNALRDILRASRRSDVTEKNLRNRNVVTRFKRLYGHKMTTFIRERIKSNDEILKFHEVQPNKVWISGVRYIRSRLENEEEDEGGGEEDEESEEEDDVDTDVSLKTLKLKVRLPPMYGLMATRMSSPYCFDSLVPSIMICTMMETRATRLVVVVMGLRGVRVVLWLFFKLNFLPQEEANCQARRTT